MNRHLVTLVVAAALAWGVSPPPLAAQIFRTSTDMVFLSVTTSRGTQAVGGLDREDFRVFEDGQPQDIAVFSREPQPIALSLLIDASTSMRSKMNMAANAAAGFIRRMRPGDTAQVIAFNSATTIRQPFTDDHALLERAIRSMATDGTTSLYTSLYIAFDELGRASRRMEGEVRRQAIVLLSDGEDTSSVLGYEDVMEKARRSDVIVFAIGLRNAFTTNAPQADRQHEYALRALAQATGGRVFFADVATQLPAIYNQVADELSSQYTIGYTSRNTNRDGAWRQIAVSVDQPGVVARTRAGYFGPRRIP